MIIDSHEHMMLPTEMQMQMMDAAGIDKTILFSTVPHPEKASSLNGLEIEMDKL
ncbi:MAG: amidohydrolase, partial [Hungatella hathewayi]